MTELVGRCYESGEPGTISGRIIIGPSRRVLFIPALRFLPHKEITRKNAASVLREARSKIKLRVRPCYEHELSPLYKKGSHQ